jgi:GntR family transcriptional repressor for pyruvate dehydrogenase complex
MSENHANGHGHYLTQGVVEHVRKAIEEHALRPGDRLPPEREMAQQLAVSRPTLRSAIGYLAAMGVLRIRHGVGTFVADGPPEIGKSALNMIGALHGSQPWQMFETRIILESSLAALATQRSQERDFTVLAEEVADMYATCDSPSEYLIHDIRFHRAIAGAAGNPILAALMETVATALYEQRRHTVEHSANLRESADFHRDIYRAIRSRDAARAAELMRQHLRHAETAQHSEGTGTPTEAAGAGNRHTRDGGAAQE